MRILLLEDDAPYAEALQKYLSQFSHNRFEIVNNLLDLDWLLYYKPGVNSYDLVILDLRLDAATDINHSNISECIPELKDFPQNSIAGINLLGLDYFQCKILTNPNTMGCARTKFFLISGHKHLIETDNLFAINNIDFPLERLLDKGVDTHATDLRLLVEQ